MDTKEQKELLERVYKNLGELLDDLHITLVALKHTFLHKVVTNWYNLTEESLAHLASILVELDKLPIDVLDDESSPDTESKSLENQG